MNGSNELIQAQEELNEKEQLFAIGLAQSGNDLEYAIAAADIKSEKEAREILNKKSFQVAVAALQKTDLQNTYYTRLCNYNYKVAKLYKMIETVTTDPGKAKELRYTPTHMLKAIELLNSMQGHNAPEQMITTNYVAGDAATMRTVNVSNDEGNPEVNALMVEYEREY